MTFEVFVGDRPQPRKGLLAIPLRREGIPIALAQATKLARGDTVTFTAGVDRCRLSPEYEWTAHIELRLVHARIVGSESVPEALAAAQQEKQDRKLKPAAAPSKPQQARPKSPRDQPPARLSQLQPSRTPSDPRPDPTPTTGTLVLSFAGADASGVELLIDGKLDRTLPNSPAPSRGKSRGRSRPQTLQVTLDLPPGDHDVVLRKNDVVVYFQTVGVKKISEGKTYHDVKLILTGTVLIKNKSKSQPDYVLVDKNRANLKLWPAHKDSLELTVESGKRLIEVYSGTDRLIKQFPAVEVEFGKETVLEIAE